MKNLLRIFILFFISIIFYSNHTYAFHDVPDNMYYTDAIYDLSNRNIVNGGPDGNFYPDNNVSRGQAAKIVAGALQLPLTDTIVAEFNDVPTSHPFSPSIQSLVRHKFMSGYPNQLFGMDDPMTREQAAKFLVTAFQIPLANTILTPFTDIDNSYAQAEITTLYAYGVTNGIEATKYGASSTITRGSLAVLIQKLEQIKTFQQTTIDYHTRNIKDIDVQYEYSNTAQLVAVHLDKQQQKLVLTPLKEGRTILVLHMTLHNGQKISVKYELVIKREQGKLTVKTTETKAVEAAQFIYEKNEIPFKPTAIIVTTSNGSIAKDVDIDMANNYVITFYEAGDYKILFKSDIGKSAEAFVSLTQQNYVLVGSAIWTDGTLLLTEDYLQSPVGQVSFSLLKDETNATPVTITKTDAGLLLQAITEGSTYLQISSGNVQFNHIIVVTKEFGYFVIDAYEIN